MMMNLKNHKRRCHLHDVLYVPSMAYNLLSVSKVAESGKKTVFSESCCEIMNKDGVVVARANGCGSLYYLDCKESERVSVGLKNKIFCGIVDLDIFLCVVYRHYPEMVSLTSYPVIWDFVRHVCIESKISLVF